MTRLQKKVNNLNLMSMISDECPNSLKSIVVACYGHYSSLNLKDSKEFILNLRLIKKAKLNIHKLALQIRKNLCKCKSCLFYL